MQPEDAGRSGADAEPKRPGADAASSPRAMALLAAGAVAGLALAGAGALLRTAPFVSGGGDVPALVNGVAITQSTYDRALTALDNDKRNPLNEADRRRVLERLVDEELLVQRGLDIGLPHSDPPVRKGIVAAMLRRILQTAAAGGDEEALRAFYAGNAAFFSLPRRVRVQRLHVRKGADSGADRERLAEVREALAAGLPFAGVRARLGDQVLPEVPDTLLPPAKLREYLGPTLTEAALGLRPGDVTEPLESERGYDVLHLADLTPGVSPPFAEVRAQVAAEFRRRRDEAALRDYLAWLREDGAVVYGAAAPLPEEEE